MTQTRESREDLEVAFWLSHLRVGFTTIEGAETQARRVGQRLDADASVVALSMGVAALDSFVPNLQRLTRDAERALYHVKRTGRHGIAATTPSGMPARVAG